MRWLKFIWALKRAQKYTDDAVGALTSGVNWKGSVDYYDNLPEDPEVGDAYTVKYTGSSGTNVLGATYAWGDDGGTNKWCLYRRGVSVSGTTIIL